MTKLEQVIKALQLCRYDPDPGQECKFLVSCDICPYWKDEFGCREVDLFNDALELLKAKDTNVPTKWVSVKDRPPTIQAGQHGIIVCDAHKNVHLTQGLIHMNIDDGVILYFDDSHSDCYWTIVSGKIPKYNTLIKGNEITHWMPLPELPKEGDGK